jgi:hypothetical protein
LKYLNPVNYSQKEVTQNSNHNSTNTMKNFILIFKGLYFGKILIDENECYNFHENIIDWLNDKDLHQIEVIHCDFLESGKTFYEFIGYEPYRPLINNEFVGLIISLKALTIHHVEDWVIKLPEIQNKNLYVELRATADLINTNFLLTN